MCLKSILVFILINFFALAIRAQPVPYAEVPYNIKETFYARFQKVTEAKWEKRKPNIYYVTFRKKDRNLNAEFEEDGQWLSTGETISVGQLPREIVSSIAKNMKGHRMKYGLKKDSYMRALIYTVTTENAGKTYEFTFNPKGKLLYYKEVPPVKP